MTSDFKRGQRTYVPYLLFDNIDYFIININIYC